MNSLPNLLFFFFFFTIHTCTFFKANSPFFAVMAEVFVPMNQLDNETMSLWSTLLGSAEKINNTECFHEVIQTLEETNTILSCGGLSQSFLEFLPNLKIVAGDIPDTELFIADYDKVEKKFVDVFKAASDQAASKVETNNNNNTSDALSSFNIRSYLIMSTSIIMTLVMIFLD